MKSDTPPKQISTRQGVVLIALVVAAITLISLVRHWAQNEAQANPSDWTPQTVAIFTNDSCTYCADAKQFLTDKKVPFTEFNLDHSEKARQVFGILNGRGVPLILVGKQRLNGYDQKTLSKILVKQGLLQ